MLRTRKQTPEYNLLRIRTQSQERNLLRTRTQSQERNLLRTRTQSEEQSLLGTRAQSPVRTSNLSPLVRRTAREDCCCDVRNSLATSRFKKIKEKKKSNSWPTPSFKRETETDRQTDRGRDRHTHTEKNGLLVQCCFTSTETVQGFLGTRAQVITPLSHNSSALREPPLCLLLQCCFTSTETVGSIMDAVPRSVYLLFYTAPKL